MVKRSRKIVSLSWRRLEGQENLSEPVTTRNNGPSKSLYECLDDDPHSPVNEATKKNLRISTRSLADVKMLVRTTTSRLGESMHNKLAVGILAMRNAIDETRQKLKRTKTRRRKRLAAEATPSPFRRSTPLSSVRRSARLAYREVKMYSPFGFETPVPTTPISTLCPSKDLKLVDLTPSEWTSSRRSDHDVASVERRMQGLVADSCPKIDESGGNSGQCSSGEHSVRSRRSRRKALFV